jgi:hypothetical protein
VQQLIALDSQHRIRSQKEKRNHEKQCKAYCNRESVHVRRTRDAMPQRTKRASIHCTSRTADGVRPSVFRSLPRSASPYVFLAARKKKATIMSVTVCRRDAAHPDPQRCLPREGASQSHARETTLLLDPVGQFSQRRRRRQGVHQRRSARYADLQPCRVVRLLLARRRSCRRRRGGGARSGCCARFGQVGVAPFAKGFLASSFGGTFALVDLDLFLDALAGSEVVFLLCA